MNRLNYWKLVFTSMTDTISGITYLSVASHRKHQCCLVTLLVLLSFSTNSIASDSTNSDQLLRQSYISSNDEQTREYFVYLPVGYTEETDKNWPVILFLHGHGQRGDGLDDLDHVLIHGPLMEAWIQRRPLPFIIISPQLPIQYGIDGVEEDHSQDPKPKRLQHGVPARNYGFKSDQPIRRIDGGQLGDGLYKRFEPYPKFGGWIAIEDDLLLILDTVLSSFRADSQQVYLTGISYGGFGTFDMAAKYPDKWAAIAPIVGTGKLKDASILAKARLPIWLFGGGKDRTIKPHWLYEMARALEQAGHPAFRFTVHEDMDHDAWKRAYEGEDLYNWFLRYTNKARP